VVLAVRPRRSGKKNGKYDGWNFFCCIPIHNQPYKPTPPISLHCVLLEYNHRGMKRTTYSCGKGRRPRDLASFASLAPVGATRVRKQTQKQKKTFGYCSPITKEHAPPPPPRISNRHCYSDCSFSPSNCCHLFCLGNPGITKQDGACNPVVPCHRGHNNTVSHWRVSAPVLFIIVTIWPRSRGVRVAVRVESS